MEKTLTEIMQDATGAPLYNVQCRILIEAARIIRAFDDEALFATIRSTNPKGDLWGALSMAEQEKHRREIAAA